MYNLLVEQLSLSIHKCYIFSHSKKPYGEGKLHNIDHMGFFVTVVSYSYFLFFLFGTVYISLDKKIYILYIHGLVIWWSLVRVHSECVLIVQYQMPNFSNKVSNLIWSFLRIVSISTRISSCQNKATSGILGGWHKSNRWQNCLVFFYSCICVNIYIYI